MNRAMMALWIGLLTGSVQLLHAQTATVITRSASNTPLEFIENKGQWPGDFLYQAEIGSNRLFLRKNGFVFKLLDPGDVEKLHTWMHGRPPAADTSRVLVPAGRAVAAAAKTGNGGGNSETGGGQGPVPAVRSHSYEVVFQGANPDPMLVPEKSTDVYRNYFLGNDSTKWRSNVQAFQNITYRQLYPHVDLHAYSEGGALKYDLLVNPGADPGAIQMAYNYTTGIEIKKGNLVIHTSVGDVIEQAPVAYQYMNNVRVDVNVSYQLKKGILSFKVGKGYDPAYTLIIDPNYVFSTFTGSHADNWGFTATYDDQGYFYAGGIVADNGYPVTPGAVQSTYAGGTAQNVPGDIGISKFTPDGTRLVYATYLGGNGLDEPHSLIVDPQGQLVMSGRTRSSNFPGKTLVGPRGDWDIVMVKLNATATAMVGSMVIGGSGMDGVNINAEGGKVATTARNYGDGARSEVLLDPAGFIYLASCTSSNNFPVQGAFQSTLAGRQDGVVLKINPNCNGIVWSSYLGGSGDDAAFVLAIPDLKSIYVGGATASSNFPSKGNVIAPSFTGGVTDGFVTHIAADGSAVLQSTFLGSTNSQADILYGLQLDANGYVYGMGTTEGNWPTKQPAGTNTFYNDNSKQFIVKMQPDLSAYVYSTTFGKKANSPSISPVAFLVDRCENVYVSGWGGDALVGGIDSNFPNSNTTGMPLKQPLQSTTDGKDFYFFVLQRDARGILFGSYFGGNGLFEHVDGGTSRFDRNGIIYQAICAACYVGGSTQPRFPTTPGAYARNKDQSVDCNLAALKISFNLDGIKAGIATAGRKTHFCLGDPITFIDTTGMAATSWTWDFGDGTDRETGPSLDTVSHTYAANGDYKVMLIKFDPSACNVYDTAYYDVRIRTDKASVLAKATRQPPCGSLSYRFDNLSQAPAGKDFTSRSFTWDFGDGSPIVTTDTAFQLHNYAAEGIYNVLLTLVDTNYCNAPETDTIPLRVAANVVASLVAPDSGCAPLIYAPNNTTKGGTSFLWDFGNGVTSTDAYPTVTYLKPGTYPVKLIAYDTTTCNQVDSVETTVTVVGAPTADYTFAPVIAKVNTPTQFTNTSSPDAVQFLWSFGDGQISEERSPEHQYNITGTFDVCLTATNSTGCADTLCQKVSAIVVPLFDVPSAFSPNNDGLNDVFLVKAFGVDKFEMKIFNRQGQLVFQSNDPKTGWDGRYKGAIQPMDAYAYEVTLVFTNGTKASKAGSVTLLR